MSTRTVSVKTFNNNINKHHHHSNNVNPNPHVTSLKPINNKKQQQPKKNQPKLQATNPKQNNPKKRRQNKKASSGHTSEDDTSSASSSSSEDDMSPKPNRRNSNKRHSFEYKSLVDQVYAGPTFNNAPAPSALPIPAFNARGSPINYQATLYHPFQQQSMDLMNLINAPQKVVTAAELEQTNLALSEIQRGLRSMLKIES